MTRSLRINGTDHTITAAPDTPLVYVLRDELKLKGTKLGCGLEQCGACLVLADGAPVMSCATAVEVFAGKEIVTIEGIGASAVGAAVQDAFVQTSAAQCGYCTAGLVVAITALLMREPAPSRPQAKDALRMHLCRCGSHPRVLRAVDLAAARR